MNICLYTSKQFINHYDNFLNNPSSLILKVDTCPFGIRPQSSSSSLIPSRFKEIEEITETIIAVQTTAIPLLSPSTSRKEGRFIETVFKLQSEVNGEYEGQTKEGKPHGIGRFVSSEFTYEGTYHEGLRDGYGMTTINGTSYFQKWKSGCLVQQIGEYQGEYQNGLPHGFGELRPEPQTILKGTFEKGVLQGLGTIESYNTHLFRSYLYCGQFVDGLYHGYGQLILNDLLFLEGDFVKGRKEGFGVLSLNTGDILFIGEWARATPNGPGTNITIEGIEQTGIWNDGWLEGVQPPIKAHFFKNASMNSLNGQNERSPNEPNNISSFTTPLNRRELFADLLARYGKEDSVQEYPTVEKKQHIEVIYEREFIEGTFSGEWLNNMPHGEGSCTYPDGSEYQGTFFQGLKDGIGISKKDGHKFLNFWQKGIFLKEAGEYIGTSIFGRPFGKGILKTADGMKINGSFENGQLNGHGMIKTANGSTYSGPFVNWLPEGHGTAELPNGDTYVGEFSKGVYEGEGIYTFFHGMMEYIGQFKNDRKEGLGKLFGIDGRFSYIGEWKDDLPNGEGSSFLKDGKFVKGLWKNGWMIGEEQHIDAWGGEYKGATMDGIPHGRGTHKQIDGTLIEADFIEGILSTVHMITNFNGEKYHHVNGNFTKVTSIVSSPIFENLTPTEATTPTSSIPGLETPERSGEEYSFNEDSQSSEEREKRVSMHPESSRSSLPSIMRLPLSPLSLNMTTQVKRSAPISPLKKISEEDMDEGDKENRTDNGKRMKLFQLPSVMKNQLE